MDMIELKQREHHKEILGLISTQLQKQKDIKNKIKQIDEIKVEIQGKENELSVASQSEDYDLAEKLQEDVNMLQTKQAKIQAEIIKIQASVKSLSKLLFKS